MVALNLLQWWYLKGWGIFAHGFTTRLRDTLDFLSIKLLIKTLFYPFRQISAGKVDGSFDVRFHAFLDRLFSRVLGAIVRIFLLIFGILLIFVEFTVGLSLLVLWPIFPLLPVVCVIFTCTGVTF